MIQNHLIAVRNGVVCFVNDNRLEVIGRELSKAFLPHQGLHAAHSDPIPLPQTSLFCLFYGTFQAAGAFQLVRCLLQQLAPMCQYQHPIAAANFVFGDFCKDDGFAAAGGQNQQRAVSALVPLPMHGGACRLLIGSHLHLVSLLKTDLCSSRPAVTATATCCSAAVRCRSAVGNSEQAAAGHRMDTTFQSGLPVQRRHLFCHNCGFSRDKCRFFR